MHNIIYYIQLLLKLHKLLSALGWWETSVQNKTFKGPDNKNGPLSLLTEFVLTNKCG